METNCFFILFWNLNESKAMSMAPCMGAIDSIEMSDNAKYIAVMTENGAELFPCDYNYMFAGWADWNDAAKPYLEVFLTLHPNYSEADISGLIETLQNHNLGFIRPDGVKQKLLEIRQDRND